MTLFGFLMPMCSRCMGLDVGFALGVLIARPWYGTKWMWIWIAIAAALLFVEMQTRHPIWHVTRFVTGALLAYPIGVAVMAMVRSRPDE